MSRPTPTVSIPVLLLLALLVGGCTAGTSTPKPSGSTSPATTPASSVLVVDGASIDRKGARNPGSPLLGAKAGAVRRLPRSATGRLLDTVDVPPQPTMLPDGTIDDGADPFDGNVVQAQPIPVEDDPNTTLALDKWSAKVREVERAQWDTWMRASTHSPWDQAADPLADSIVKVAVERCGGAQTIATGVVLANETVVTTVHAIESAQRRVRISPSAGDGVRIPAMIRYLDIDNDIAVLKVPGLKLAPMTINAAAGGDPQWSRAYGVGRGGVAGLLRRVPSIVAMEEATISVEQPDGFADQIRDRSVYPMVGAIDTGFSGGVVASTNDPALATGWGFHGLIRARVPYRADTGGIVIPSRLVRDALTASDQLDTWFEHHPGGCPQWRR